MLGGVLMFGAAGCTDDFERFNTDPKAPTPEQMEGDFASTATLISNMIPFALVNGQENKSQMLDVFVGACYGGMSAQADHWNSGLQNYGTLNPPVGWSGNTFDETMPGIYTPFFMIRDISGGEGLTYYWANLLRIIGTLRVSDTYGPTPFSKIGSGTDFAVAYDDMPTLYNAMFEQLDLVIAGLKESVGSTTTTSLFGNVDYIYGGDISKWVKLANTIKLRMALRLVNVEPALAKQKAEEAVSDAGGLISEPGDAAWSSFLPGGNALHKQCTLWGDTRVSADITSYMNGYNDPRLPIYMTKATNDTYTGARIGVPNAKTTTGYQGSSQFNMTAESKLLAIAASESWFARAEGALRGWTMGGDAKYLYEQGVKVSMQERGAQIGNYLESTAVPAKHVDLESSSYNIDPVSTVCPEFDETASFEVNLERIMVQKWLGNFPNGWETWADFRRTGYPKHFPVVVNYSTDGVSSSRGMRRLPFPQSEFNTNEANVKAAQQMLGGPDTGATDLWWAKKN